MSEPWVSAISLELGNAAAHQVVVAHSAFAESWVGARSAGGDDHRSDAALEQIVGVIETGAEDGGGASGVFSRAEDDDGVRRANLLQAGLVHDADAGDPEKGRDRGRSQRHYPQGPGGRPPIFFSIHPGHPCAKNSEISWAGMAPSRMMRQRASSSVRSMMVEATSRGDVPPSTMIEMRSCS